MGGWVQLVGVEARENEKHNPFLIAAEESRSNIPLDPFLVPLSLWHSLTHSPVCRRRRRQQVSSVQGLFHTWAMLRFSGRSGVVLPHTACVRVWLLHQDRPTYPPCGLCWWMGYWWSNPYPRMKPSGCPLAVVMQVIHSCKGVKEPWAHICLLPMYCFHEPFWWRWVGLQLWAGWKSH